MHDILLLHFNLSHAVRTAMLTKDTIVLCSTEIITCNNYVAYLDVEIFEEHDVVKRKRMRDSSNIEICNIFIYFFCQMWHKPLSVEPTSSICIVCHLSGRVMHVALQFVALRYKPVIDRAMCNMFLCYRAHVYIPACRIAELMSTFQAIAAFVACKPNCFRVDCAIDGDELIFSQTPTFEKDLDRYPA